MKNKLLILSGPTASGKTDLAIELAQKIDGIVVNFDSLLFYNELNIGTAKPSRHELSLVPHFLINISSIRQPINASDYCRLATPLIEKLLQEDKNIILTGGSGFYLQTLLRGMFDSPTTPEEIRIKSDKIYDEQGIAPFVEILKLNDPHSLKNYHLNDHYRIRRSVEHWWTNHTPFSAEREKHTPKTPFWSYLHCYLDIPKDLHWNIIKQRTQKMLSNGLFEEVNTLLKSGFTGLEKPLQSIGYKEAIQFIRGDFSKDECLDRIIISTRQLAKSQRTWFKKENKICFNPLLEKNNFLQMGELFFTDHPQDSNQQ